MASPKLLFFSIVVLISSNSRVESASIFERSYDYMINLGKNIAPSFMTLLDCLGEDDVWICAKEKAGKMLDSWDSEVDKQRRMWQDAADAEVTASGRSITELPSQLSKEVEESLYSLTDLVQHGVARALSRKHSGEGGIDSITISTSDKKKKHKKQKPPKIHLVHPMMMAKEEDSGLNPKSLNESEKKDSVSNQKDSIPKLDETISNLESQLAGSEKESNFSREVETESDVFARKGRGMFADMWAIGEKAIDSVAQHAVEHENAENEISDKSSFEENRGKKKKKKKAILKLLILGAVLKAKIGTLLQILSFKLQVKFFLIALIGLGINLARFWLDLKKQHSQPQKIIYEGTPWDRRGVTDRVHNVSLSPPATRLPQEVIYYEHAQHQHHYDHEHEEEPGWGPWSRSIDNEDTDGEVDASAMPYRAQVVRNPQLFNRPVPSV